MIIRIYEKEYVTLDYDPSVPCVIATSLNFMILEEFKAQLNFGLDFMKEKIKETGRMMWLPDTTLSPAVDSQGAEWVIKNWTPRALAAGIKHVSFIVAESEWAKMAIEEYSETVHKEGMTTSYFKDVESAKKWFSEINR